VSQVLPASLRDFPAPFREFDGQIAVELPGAQALFTTAGWGDIRETQPVVAHLLGVDIARPTQVHGTTVLRTAQGPVDGALAEADAIATTTHGIAPTVISADCVPIVIAGAGVVAAVHAGWRGLRDGVIGEAVKMVRSIDSGSQEALLTAAIGPCAGACCYEVSDELHQTFAERAQDLRDGQNLDLNAIARRQLTDAGVGTTHDLGLCTVCSDPGLLFSYRRDHGATGRQGALIWLT
jgi:YfiH family protein